MRIRNLAEQIETDRQIRSASTYSSCICGLYHVPGCKVRKLEWFLTLGAIVIGSGACWWFFIA